MLRGLAIRSVNSGQGPGYPAEASQRIILPSCTRPPFDIRQTMSHRYSAAHHHSRMRTVRAGFLWPTSPSAAHQHPRPSVFRSSSTRIARRNLILNAKVTNLIDNRSTTGKRTSPRAVTAMPEEIVVAGSTVTRMPTTAQHIDGSLDSLHAKTRIWGRDP